MPGICDICSSESAVTTCPLCGARVCRSCSLPGACKRCAGGRSAK